MGEFNPWELTAFVPGIYILALQDKATKTYDHFLPENGSTAYSRGIISGIYIRVGFHLDQPALGVYHDSCSRAYDNSAQRDKG